MLIRSQQLYCGLLEMSTNTTHDLALLTWMFSIYQIKFKKKKKNCPDFLQSERREYRKYGGEGVNGQFQITHGNEVLRN